MKLAANFRALIAPAAGAASALLLFATSASGATNQPLPPTGLSVESATTSSVSVVWRPPADTSVVAYAYFLNGTRLGAVPTFHRTLTGLACGKTYAIGVDAYNAAQVHSSMVVVNAPTAACTSSPPPPPAPTPAPSPGTTPPSGGDHGTPPPPTTGGTGTGTTSGGGTSSTGNPKPGPKPVPNPPPPSGSTGIVVAVGGSDRNPCTASAPCATFDRAYHLANPGATVQVMGGSYPAQIVKYDATKVGAAADVVFQSAPGALVALSGLTVDGASHITFVGASPGDLSAAQSGLTLSPNPTAMNTGSFFTATNCASYVTVKNLDMESFFITGADHITVTGGTTGGVDNAQVNPLISGPYQGRGTSYCSAEAPYAIVVQNVLLHDVLRTNIPAGHPDCLQIAGTTGTLLDGNRFVRCGTADVLVRPALNIWTGNVIDNVTIQNNSLTPAVQGSNVLFLGGPTDTCGSIAVLNNTSTTGLSSFACSSYKSLRVIGNHVNSMTAYGCSLIANKPSVVFDSNYFLTGPTCGTRATIG